MWSSTKVNGRPLRWYAERGESAPRTPRAVIIESLTLWRDDPSASPDRIAFRCVAGKGCSMRVMAHDLGAALGCGAHLVELRREGVGGFSVERAWTLDVFLPLARRFAKGFRGAPAPRPPGVDDSGGGSYYGG